MASLGSERYDPFTIDDIQISAHPHSKRIMAYARKDGISRSTMFGVDATLTLREILDRLNSSVAERDYVSKKKLGLISPLTHDAADAKAAKIAAERREMSMHLFTGMDDVERLATLLEGLGAVGQSVSLGVDNPKLVSTLLELGALSLMWVESIEGQSGG